MMYNDNPGPGKVSLVTQTLLELYGEAQVWQVERMRENIFRGWLNNGSVAMAIVQGDNTVTVKDVPALW